MAKQNIELQIEALERLMKEVDDLIKDIEKRKENYMTSVQHLKQQNLDVNVAQQYTSQYWQQNNVMMQQLRDRLKNSDLPYIKRCLAGARTALANYKG